MIVIKTNQHFTIENLFHSSYFVLTLIFRIDCAHYLDKAWYEYRNLMYFAFSITLLSLAYFGKNYLIIL